MMAAVWVCNPDAVGRLAVANVLRRTPGVRVVGTSADPPQRATRPYNVLVHHDASAQVAVIAYDDEAPPSVSALSAPAARAASAYRSWASDVLLPALNGLVLGDVARHDSLVGQPAQTAVCDVSPVPHVGVSVVAIAASTGGPDAVEQVLMGLGSQFPVPIVVVQHMGEAFTAGFAARLDRRVGLSIVHAEDGMRLLPGTVVVARGGRHLEVARDERGYFVHLTDGPTEHGCRPAADVMFRSLGCTDGRVLAVVLTGLGEDGGRGAASLRQQGARVLVQDQHSSVIWGMPGAVVARGAADEVLPLDDIAGRITHHTLRTLYQTA